jgi:protein SCO1/2
VRKRFIHEKKEPTVKLAMNLVMVTLTIFLTASIRAEEKSKPFPSNSIFWLNSDWVRHDGIHIHLSELGETPTIVSMVFLSCKYSCPLTIQDMKEIDRDLQKSAKKPYKMVLISIDPDRDTPKAMNAFIKGRHLDPSRWILLSSTAENIRELAAALGYSYKKDQAMDFAHSMLTWVFDKNGVKRFTREARKQSISETVASAEKLLK